MSEPSPAYSVVMIKAWMGLSIFVGLLLLSMFIFGDAFLNAGYVVWGVLRFLASPFI